MILAIVQARMGSIRFPGKVLKEVNSKSLIEILLYRLSRSVVIDKIILATSINPENNILTEKVKKLGFEVFRGSEKNVLERYYRAAVPYNPEVVVRITGDCPIIDPLLVDEVIELFVKNDVDYVSNGDPPTYPDGLDTEVFSFSSLEETFNHAISPFEREHVTPYLRNNDKFKRLNYFNKTDLASERWTVDNVEDFEVVKCIINHFAPNLDFTWQDVMDIKKNHPEYFEANEGIKRDEGSKQAWD